MTHAIILAAGRNSGFAEEKTEFQLDCLAVIGGKTLLSRHLDLLYRLGVQAVDLVVGYDARKVIDHVATLDSRPDVAYHFNPRYEAGSVLSLWAAAETLASGKDVLLMDSGLLYHPAILQRLLESPLENCFLLDRETEYHDSAMNIALHGGRMVDFCRSIPAGLECDGSGVSPGMYRFGPKAAECIGEECERHEEEGLEDAPYEEILRNVMLSCPLAFGFEDISGMPWARIESPSDLARAGETLLPAIRAG